MGGEAFLTELPFEEAIDFQEGPGILAKDFRDTGVPLVRLAGLSPGVPVLSGCNYLDPEMVDQKWSHFRLEAGDILLSTSASLGRIAIVDDKAAGTIAYTGIIRMRPRNEKTIREFIPYLLRSRHFQLQCEAMGVGSVIRHFGPSHLRQMTLRLPPLPEQRAIAHILGSLDDKIELNRRMNQTLEAMALAIFKSWFVDFDPVRAKAEGRPTGLPDDIAALFPDSFEDSELGSIPKGWEVKKFKQFVTPRNERVEDRDIPEYSSTNEGLFPRTDKFKKQLSKSKAKNKIIRKNDIVFGLSRQILNFGIMKDTIGAVSPAYHVYSINTSTIFSDFVEQYMRKRMHLFYGILGASSREGQSISVQQFYQTRLLIPPKIIQNKFKERTNDFHRSIKHSENEALTLASLRDTLLPKLISGELRVPDAEKFAREAGV